MATRYKVFKGAVQYDSWTSDTNDATFFQNKYGHDPAFRLEMTDITSEINEERDRQIEFGQLKLRLATLARQSDLTAAEVKEGLMKALKFLVIRKDFQ